MSFLPAHKSKIVATVGPASESPEMLERLIRAGLNVARLNFSHGDFAAHRVRIEAIRAACVTVSRRACQRARRDAREPRAPPSAAARVTASMRASQAPRPRLGVIPCGSPQRNRRLHGIRNRPILAS